MTDNQSRFNSIYDRLPAAAVQDMPADLAKLIEAKNRIIEAESRLALSSRLPSQPFNVGATAAPDADVMSAQNAYAALYDSIDDQRAAQLDSYLRGISAPATEGISMVSADYRRAQIYASLPDSVDRLKAGTTDETDPEGVLLVQLKQDIVAAHARNKSVIDLGNARGNVDFSALAVTSYEEIEAVQRFNDAYRAIVAKGRLGAVESFVTRQVDTGFAATKREARIVAESFNSAVEMAGAGIIAAPAAILLDLPNKALRAAGTGYDGSASGAVYNYVMNELDAEKKAGWGKGIFVDDKSNHEIQQVDNVGTVMLVASGAAAIPSLLRGGVNLLVRSEAELANTGRITSGVRAGESVTPEAAAPRTAMGSAPKTSADHAQNMGSGMGSSSATADDIANSANAARGPTGRRTAPEAAPAPTPRSSAEHAQDMGNGMARSAVTADDIAGSANAARDATARRAASETQGAENLAPKRRLSWSEWWNIRKIERNDALTLSSKLEQLSKIPGAENAIERVLLTLRKTDLKPMKDAVELARKNPDIPQALRDRLGQIYTTQTAKGVSGWAGRKWDAVDILITDAKVRPVRGSLNLAWAGITSPLRIATEPIKIAATPFRYAWNGLGKEGLGAFSPIRYARNAAAASGAVIAYRELNKAVDGQIPAMVVGAVQTATPKVIAAASTAEELTKQAIDMIPYGTGDKILEVAGDYAQATNESTKTALADGVTIALALTGHDNIMAVPDGNTDYRHQIPTAGLPVPFKLGVDLINYYIGEDQEPEGQEEPLPLAFKPDTRKPDPTPAWVGRVPYPDRSTSPTQSANADGTLVGAAEYDTLGAPSGVGGRSVADTVGPPYSATLAAAAATLTQAADGIVLNARNADIGAPRGVGEALPDGLRRQAQDLNARAAAMDAGTQAGMDPAFAENLRRLTASLQEDHGHHAAPYPRSNPGADEDGGLDEEERRRRAADTEQTAAQVRAIKKGAEDVSNRILAFIQEQGHEHIFATLGAAAGLAFGENKFNKVLFAGIYMALGAWLDSSFPQLGLSIRNAVVAGGKALADKANDPDAFTPENMMQMAKDNPFVAGGLALGLVTNGGAMKKGIAMAGFAGLGYAFQSLILGEKKTRSFTDDALAVADQAANAASRKLDEMSGITASDRINGARAEGENFLAEQPPPSAITVRTLSSPSGVKEQPAPAPAQPWVRTPNGLEAPAPV